MEFPGSRRMKNNKYVKRWLDQKGPSKPLAPKSPGNGGAPNVKPDKGGKKDSDQKFDKSDKPDD